MSQNPFHGFAMLRSSALKAISVAASLAMIAAAPSSAIAQSADRVEVGQLTCNAEASVGFVFGSTKDITCTFDPAGYLYNETYTGSIDKFGLDIGYTGPATLVWTVLAPTDDLPPSSLAGTYGGAAVDGSLGVGGGAKLLVGGSDDTIMLQPLSLQAQTGANLAITVASLNLRAVKRNKVVEYAPRAPLCNTQVRLAPGDTIADIAARCGRTVDDVLEVNPSITNTREVPSWSLINVPAYPTPTNSVGCGTHATLKSGETIYRLAKRCGVSAGAIIDANPKLRYDTEFEPGQVFNMPTFTTAVAVDRCPRTVRLGAPNTRFGNLTTIAQTCGTTVDALLTANPSVANVREIPTGKVITVPRAKRLQRGGTCGSHAVAKDNDTLFAIAKRCNVGVGALLDVNPRLRTATKLEAGRTVDLPMGARRILRGTQR